MQRDSGHSLVSRRRYGVAVALSAVFGVLGVHHFYLGRHGLGLLDMGMTIVGFALIALDHTALGVLVLAVDFFHGLFETIRLAIGAYHDGDGAVVAYPGQILTRREPS